MTLPKKKIMYTLIHKNFFFSLWIMIVAGAGIVATLGGVFFLFSQAPEDQSLVLLNNTSPETRFEWWLDGHAVSTEQEQYIRPYAVMIDQGMDSGPLVGIDEASVVFEALVEGGVTRLMALFDPKVSVQKIGPIRSVRPYFVDWAHGFDAVLAHAGGSPTALRLIDGLESDHLNEISSDGRYFFRDPQKYSPHNLFIKNTNIPWEYKKWYTVIDEQGNRPWEWARGVTDGVQGQTVSHITIDFSRTSYTVEWKQSDGSKKYQRYRGGVLENTADGKGVFAVNIIVQYVQVGLEDELRLTMKTIGEGEALICSVGQCADGIWKRKDRNQPTQFFVNSSPPSHLVKLLPGSTWIEAVPEGRTVTIQ
ncbi:MAG TPA: DUF3048 domain-containing protein [Patescibacteria group bacterium]|nr:DUF3048 domain-containing protein [Patescibacteria group bacterium]